MTAEQATQQNPHMQLSYGLKPCPFCGGEGEVFFDDDTDEWRAQCAGNCGITNVRSFKTAIKAAESWNVRGGSNAPTRSVLQDWVMRLPLREQGTLLTAVRGCDLVPKYPLNSIERRLVGAIRAAFMVPADPREVDREPGCFFISQPPDPAEFKPSALGHYPQHWVSHLLHAMEVLAYRHPAQLQREWWIALYWKLAQSLHLNPETRDQMIQRLGEDRIATGTVVS